MDRMCNREHVFDFIIKYFAIIDGKLFRKYKNSDKWREISGCLRGSYLVCKVDKYQLFIHNVVMVLKTQAKIPEGAFIDHIDGNKLNNSVDNLRLVTRSINAQNVDITGKSGTGYANINQISVGKYRVKYTSGGKQINLGCFDTFQKALQARNNSYAIHAPERLAFVMRRGG